MTIQALQHYIEANCPGACVPVDLLKIARSISIRRGGGGRGNFRPPYFYNNRLSLVVDGECCLDRLYGGYFSDWVCGGQWNRMVQFLSVLIQTIQNNSIELAIFFNGSLEPQRMNEWIKEQQADRKKVNQVLKHVATKATPPPKVWWIPPVCLRTCLRMALRHLNVTVVCTMDDHHQEVIAFCRENNFQGLMAEDAEYAIFDPPRYFSSEQLKLTYKGSLETREIILDEVAKSLNLNPDRFCILASLLGNYLLTEDDLAPFHKSLASDSKTKLVGDALIKEVVNFVRNLPTTDNLDSIGFQIFGPEGQDKIQKYKQCVYYYMNGTKEGFLRYRPTMQGRRHEPGCYPGINNLATISERSALSSHSDNKGVPNSNGEFHVKNSRFASETEETEKSSLSAYQKATSGTPNNPQIVIEPPHQQTSMFHPSSQLEKEDYSSSDGKYMMGPNSGPRQVNGSGLNRISSSSSSSSSPVRLSPEVSWQSQQKGNLKAEFTESTPSLPAVSPEVMRTASERHQKGLMNPWIYQILSQGEIKIPVSFEEEIPRDLPAPSALYRPLRQMVYAILFNLHHLQFLAKQKKENEGIEEKVPSIVIREWAWNRGKLSPEPVTATPIGWAVPTVQRLWFGSSVDDKKRRLRAFLTCMRSDSPLMLNTSYVPQHLLVMCCVLRYIMSETERPILRKQELDAFLAQAVSPQLMNAQHTQNMQLPLVATRGIQLASLFMHGVECALFANDACGAPIPWLMCCPWLFFDGKLFHHKLLKANGAKNLAEVCEGQLDQVAKVERMRSAILKDLQVEFARPPQPILPRPAGLPGGAVGYPPAGFHLPGAGAGGRGRGLLGSRQRVLARGGQLEIAGVVVGSWGPNYGQMPHRARSLPPQVTSIGGVRRYGGPGLGPGLGFIPRRGPINRFRKPGPISAFQSTVACTRKKATKKTKGGKDDAPSPTQMAESAKENQPTAVLTNHGGSQGGGI